MIVALGLAPACAHEPPASALAARVEPAAVADPEPAPPARTRRYPPPITPAPTPGRDFIASLRQCAAARVRSVDDLKPEQFGSPVAVRGALSIGSWGCEMKKCYGPNGEAVCCNPCAAAWLVTPTDAAQPNGRNGVGFVVPGGRGPHGLGAWDCHTEEISRATPRPDVLLSGVLAPAGEWSGDVKYLVTDADLCVVGGAAGP